MEKAAADVCEATLPREVSSDQLGYSFDEPGFTPIVPNILIVTPSTPDRSDSSRNSADGQICSFGGIEQHVLDNETKEASESEEEQKKEDEIAEDMTVSSSPLNERHCIRAIVHTIPTNVDDEQPVVMDSVLNSILRKETLEENPPFPRLLLPPNNLDIVSERMPVVQLSIVHEFKREPENPRGHASNRRFSLWNRCCALM